MANPVIINVPANEWHKIATAVQNGLIRTLNPTDNEWYQTFKLTGQSAPTDEPEVKLLFQTDIINADVDVDIYVYHKKTPGRVRIDI